MFVRASIGQYAFDNAGDRGVKWSFVVIAGTEWPVKSEKISLLEKDLIIWYAEISLRVIELKLFKHLMGME